MPYKNPDKGREYRKEYYQKNKDRIKAQVSRYATECPERVKQQHRSWHERNKEYVRDRSLQRKYGIKLEDMNKIIKDQNGLCAICGVELSSLPQKQICVDHNHNTLQVRGILCHHCNVLLGHANDNINTLRKAADYVETKAT